MPDSSSDSDDDIPLAQRASAVEAPPAPKLEVKTEPAKAAAEPAKRKADASPTSPKKQKAPSPKAEVKAEAKPAAKPADQRGQRGILREGNLRKRGILREGNLNIPVRL